jgi:hypothetical protein
MAQKFLFRSERTSEIQCSGLARSTPNLCLAELDCARSARPLLPSPISELVDAKFAS